MRTSLHCSDSLLLISDPAYLPAHPKAVPDIDQLAPFDDDCVDATPPRARAREGGAGSGGASTAAARKKPPKGSTKQSEARAQQLRVGCKRKATAAQDDWVPHGRPAGAPAARDRPTRSRRQPARFEMFDVHAAAAADHGFSRSEASSDEGQPIAMASEDSYHSSSSNSASASNSDGPAASSGAAAARAGASGAFDLNSSSDSSAADF